MFRYKTYQYPKCGKKKYVIIHILFKNYLEGFMVVGIYSRRGYRHRQTEFHEREIILTKRSWREEIKKTFHHDPLLCPDCNTEMEFIGICYEWTEIYPTEEPSP